MARYSRSNLLALAVLACLYERPMHPYEMATVMRQRGKHESIKLNYGSLYTVVQSLQKAQLIEPLETLREGHRPERTVYGLTGSGEVELVDWLSEMVSTPAKEYPQFEAALSLLPVLPPDDALSLLQERSTRLEIQLAQFESLRQLLQGQDFPELFWIEGDYAQTMCRAELDWVRKLLQDISQDRLGGAELWRQLAAGHGPPTPDPEE